MKEIKEKEESFWYWLSFAFAVLGVMCALLGFVCVTFSDVCKVINDAPFWLTKVYGFGFFVAAIVLIVASSIADTRRHDWAIKYLKEDVMQLSNACKAILDNQQELYDYINEVEENN